MARRSCPVSPAAGVVLISLLALAVGSQVVVRLGPVVALLAGAVEPGGNRPVRRSTMVTVLLLR